MRSFAIFFRVLSIITTKALFYLTPLDTTRSITGETKNHHKKMKPDDYKVKLHMIQGYASLGEYFLALHSP